MNTYEIKYRDGSWNHVRGYGLVWKEGKAWTVDASGNSKMLVAYGSIHQVSIVEEDRLDETGRQLPVKNDSTNRLIEAANYALDLCQVPVKARTPTGIAKVIESLGWAISTEGQKGTETHSNERKPTDS